MRLFSAFKTLPWEQRDPALRAHAVRESQAPELIARLSEIAAQDAEPVVRRAALARLSVAEFVLERHRSDADAETRAAALARLQKLLLDPQAGLAPGARQAALTLDLPAELFERVAESASDVEARRAALARIARPGFLQRRCVDEPDAALRAELLERIDGEDVLDRLAEQLRKRDKTLARRARERAEASRLARGDAAALQRYAVALCETLTAWAQQQPDDLEQGLTQAQAEWEARATQFDAAMRLRVEAYFQRVREAQARRVQRTAEPEPAAAMVPEAINVPVPVDADAGGEIAARPARAAPDWSEFDRLLAEARRAVVAKHLGEARPAWQALREAMKTAPKLDRTRRERLAEVEAQIEELDRWQRWSGNRARARLCDEVEALIAAAPHPDAVANRVRELQAEWIKVTAAEPDGTEQGAGIERRFRALCARAMAPTRAYFEKRDELRGQRREAFAALLAQAAQDALATQTPPGLIALRRRLVEALRELDGLDPKARTAMAKQLREGLTRLDAALEAQRDEAALTRRKLLAKLRRELTHADSSTALALARDAQQEWQTLPRAGRDQAAALEHELQTLIEPLFARERGAREQASQQLERVTRESQRLLDELAALASGDAETLAHADGRIAALSAQWRELHASTPAERESKRPAREPAGRGREPRRPERAPRPSDAERRFDQAVAKVKQAQQALATQRRGTHLRALAEVAALFATLARGDVDAATADAHWQALGLDETARKRLLPRWTQAQRGEASPGDAAARAQWLVEAELDAGIDSPLEAQAQRRQAQMQRLATRLQGAQANGPEAGERMLRWALLEGVPSEADQARVARVLAIWAGASSDSAG